MPQQLYDSTLQGFGNLAGALLLAPQMARRRRDEQEERVARDQQHQAALAQALQISQNAAEARAQDRADRMAYNNQQLELTKNRDAANKANMENDNAWNKVEGVGRGIYNGGKLLLSALHGGAGKASKPTIPTTREIVDEKGNKLTQQWDPEHNEWIDPPIHKNVATPEATAVVDARNDPNYLTQALQVAGKASPMEPVEPGSAFWKHPIGSTSRAIGNAVYGQPKETPEQWNAGQDASLAQPYVSPTNPNQFKFPPVIQRSGPVEPAALNLQGLTPEAQMSVQRIMASGDEARIAELKRRLAGMGR